MSKIIKRKDRRYDPFLFYKTENLFCVLEAGSGNARKGPFMSLRPSKAHFYLYDRLRVRI
jgi:hypothetical protein